MSCYWSDVLPGSADSMQTELLVQTDTSQIGSGGITNEILKTGLSLGQHSL